jgi:hypothetical protein
MSDHERLSAPDQVNGKEVVPERSAQLSGVSNVTEGATVSIVNVMLEVLPARSRTDKRYMPGALITPLLWKFPE